MPKVFALAITLLATVVVVTVLDAGRLGLRGGRSLAIREFRPPAGTVRQTTYWLEGTASSRCHGHAGILRRSWLTAPSSSHRPRAWFCLVASSPDIFLLGLLEVDTARKKLAGLSNQEPQSPLKAGDTTPPFRRYMLVRTAMSVTTGFVIPLRLRASSWPPRGDRVTLNTSRSSTICDRALTLFAIAQSESWKWRSSCSCA